MLSFPDNFLSDKKANDIVKRYWNHRLLQMLEATLDVSVSNGDFEKISEDDEYLGTMLQSYLPESYTLQQRIQTAQELYFLLTSKEEHAPKINVQYLMASMIEAQLGLYEDMKLSSREPIMEDRAYLLEVLDKEYGKGINTEDDWYPSADEKLAEIEDLKNYLTLLFWDTDHALLDEFSEEQIIKSGADDVLGIGLSDRNKFIIDSNSF